MGSIGKLLPPLVGGGLGFLVGGPVGAAVGAGIGTGVSGSMATDEASEASLKGAGMQATGQREALDYLKEREAIPRQFSEAALQGLGGLYGLEGGTGSQQELIDRSIASPLYQSIMGGREEGEEAILRNLSATGGLRSGNAQEALYDYNTQLQNRALLESYNQQLQGLVGLAGLPSNANQIASQMSGIGQTLGQGQIAAGQAQQAGTQQMMGNLMGLGQLGISAYGAGMFGGGAGGAQNAITDPSVLGGGFNFSDRRLKNNIEKVCEVGGHNWYKWDWNIVANKMGLDGKSEGVLADEIVNTNPECIGFFNHFMIVDYGKLGIFPAEVAHG